MASETSIWAPARSAQDSAPIDEKEPSSLKHAAEPTSNGAQVVQAVLSTEGKDSQPHPTAETTSVPEVTETNPSVDTTVDVTAQNPSEAEPASSPTPPPGQKLNPSAQPFVAPSSSAANRKRGPSRSLAPGSPAMSASTAGSRKASGSSGSRRGGSSSTASTPRTNVGYVPPEVVKPTKLTPEELAEKMERMRLINEQTRLQAEAREADARAYEESQAADRQRAAEQIKAAAEAKQRRIQEQTRIDAMREKARRLKIEQLESRKAAGVPSTGSGWGENAARDDDDDAKSKEGSSSGDQSLPIDVATSTASLDLDLQPSPIGGRSSPLDCTDDSCPVSECSLGGTAIDKYVDPDELDKNDNVSAWAAWVETVVPSALSFGLNGDPAMTMVLGQQENATADNNHWMPQQEPLSSHPSSKSIPEFITDAVDGSPESDRGGKALPARHEQTPWYYNSLHPCRPSGYDIAENQESSEPSPWTEHRPSAKRKIPKAPSYETQNSLGMSFGNYHRPPSGQGGGFGRSVSRTGTNTIEVDLKRSRWGRGSNSHGASALSCTQASERDGQSPRWSLPTSESPQSSPSIRASYQAGGCASEGQFSYDQGHDVGPRKDATSDKSCAAHAGTGHRTGAADDGNHHTSVWSSAHDSTAQAGGEIAGPGNVADGAADLDWGGPPAPQRPEAARPTPTGFGHSGDAVAGNRQASHPVAHGELSQPREMPPHMRDATTASRAVRGAIHPSRSAMLTRDAGPTASIHRYEPETTNYFPERPKDSGWGRRAVSNAPVPPRYAAKSHFEPRRTDHQAAFSVSSSGGARKQPGIHPSRLQMISQSSRRDMQSTWSAPLPPPEQTVPNDGIKRDNGWGKRARVGGQPFPRAEPPKASFRQDYRSKTPDLEVDDEIIPAIATSTAGVTADDGGWGSAPQGPAMDRRPSAGMPVTPSYENREDPFASSSADAYPSESGKVTDPGQGGGSIWTSVQVDGPPEEAKSNPADVDDWGGPPDRNTGRRGRSTDRTETPKASRAMLTSGGTTAPPPGSGAFISTGNIWTSIPATEAWAPNPVSEDERPTQLLSPHDVSKASSVTAASPPSPAAIAAAADRADKYAMPAIRSGDRPPKAHEVASTWRAAPCSTPSPSVPLQKSYRSPSLRHSGLPPRSKAPALGNTTALSLAPETESEIPKGDIWSTCPVMDLVSFDDDEAVEQKQSLQAKATATTNRSDQGQLVSFGDDETPTIIDLSSRTRKDDDPIALLEEVGFVQAVDLTELCNLFEDAPFQPRKN